MEPIPSQPLGEMLRARRKGLGLTLDVLSERVGLTPGALSHIESGKRLPDPKNAIKIAASLGLAEEDVLVALDEAHARRRRSSAQVQSGDLLSSMPARSFSARQERSYSNPQEDVRFQAMSIDALRSSSVDANSRNAPQRSARNMARWSEDTADRLTALDQLADTAADAIRTLRGLLEDEDPLIRREAHRLLRELDVRMPEE